MGRGKFFVLSIIFWGLETVGLQAGIDQIDYKNPKFCRSLLGHIAVVAHNPSQESAFLSSLPSDRFSTLAKSPLLRSYAALKFLSTEKSQSLANIAREVILESAKTDHDHKVMSSELDQFDRWLYLQIDSGQSITEILKVSSDEVLEQLPDSKSNRHYKWKQFLALPRTMMDIWRIVRGHYEFGAFDENLWTFWGFHHDSKIKHYRMRTWPQVKINNIGPWQVQNMSTLDLARMMNVAMEIEDPISGYSAESGRGFRFLLPTLGRFMGKNPEQAAFAKQNGIDWCESAWCEEEKRHGNAFARMITLLTGQTPSRDNPTEPMAVTSDEAAAVSHLHSRESTEWNASTVYVVMAAHAQGELRDFIFNLMDDEIKHLTVVSSADIYLHGYRPWKRLHALVKKALEEVVYHSKHRTEGAAFSSSISTVIEVAFAHMLTEIYTRRFLKTLPYPTLKRIFESPSTLPELLAFKPEPEVQKQMDEEEAKGQQKRLSLERWTEKMRASTLELVEFETRNSAILDEIVQRRFNRFLGCEEYSSLRSKAMRGQITDMKANRFFSGDDAERDDLLQKALYDRLRDYQIRNNAFVTALKAKDSRDIQKLQRAENP